MAQGRYRVGLYPGTFDPLTLGHSDIMRRALHLVDKLVIGVAINEAKGPLFTLEERVEIVKEVAEGLNKDLGVEIVVQPMKGLLVNFADEVGADMIIRGLRAVSDFEYEFQMVGMNTRLNDKINTVFLMAEAEHQFVASSLVKEIAKLGGDVSPFLDPLVADRLKSKFS